MKQRTKTDSPNVLLITIDSLRYDHLSCYGYQRNTSPNIDALAARGARFLQAISNGGQTPQSFPSILASALPPLDRVESETVLKKKTTLAVLLKKTGYHTAAFHSNPYLSRLYGYNHGFDVFDDDYHKSNPRRLKFRIRRVGESHKLLARAVDEDSLITRLYRLYISLLPDRLTRPITNAELIIDKAISHIENHQERFFLWLHYMDVHHPYMPEEKYVSQFYNQPVSRREMNALWRKMLNKPGVLSGSEIELLVSLYDANIKYTDEIIGRLLDKLENCLDNTVVIITADHGDEFGEHGRFGHNTVYDELLHVPLIITGPGVGSDILVEQQVSLIDLSPTVADLTGIGSEPSFMGRSLLPVIEGRGDIVPCTISTYLNQGLWKRNIAYRIPGWKYILTESLDEGHMLSEEIYNLKNDPGETNNLHGTGNDAANKFELEAKRRVAQFKQTKIDEKIASERQRIRVRLGKHKKL